MENGLNRQRISRNVVATVAQVVVSGVIFFIFYRYLLDHIGIEQIGIWSLVVATTATSRIGDLGLADAVVRYVARALGQGDIRRAGEIIQTIALTVGVLMAVLLAVCFPLFVAALEYFLPERGVPPAMTVLPYALVSFWAVHVASVFLGGLDGCQRIDLRCVLMVIAQLAYLGLMILWVPTYGLEGVALAQVVQSLGLVALAWCVLRRQNLDLPFIPLRWRFSVLREIIGYSATLQATSLMNILFAPMTTALASKFGGLAALGYYEMANKLILQVRAMIVESNRVIVPAIASFRENGPEQIKQVFVGSYGLVLYIAVLLFACLAIFLPLISVLWIGTYNSMFVQFVLLLTLGWLVNTVAAPAFYSNLGTGEVRRNLGCQALTCVVGLCSSIFLGQRLGGTGVVIGAVLGLMTGSLFLAVFHMRKLDLHLAANLLPKEMWMLVTISVVAIWFSNHGDNTQRMLFELIGIGSVCALSVLLVGWYHPMRKKFFQRR